MKTAISTVFAAFFATTAFAADLATEASSALDGPGPYEAIELDLNDFLWLKRPIVVFADTEADPRFIQQMDLLTRRIDALEDRDVVILTDTDPAAKSAIRLKLRPRGFMMVLIGKDGGVKLRKPAPWSVREIGRVIDKMPVRQQELRDRRLSDD